MAKDPHEEDIARRRDELVKRMIATPPKTQRGKPKRATDKKSQPKGAKPKG